MNTPNQKWFNLLIATTALCFSQLSLATPENKHLIQCHIEAPSQIKAGQSIPLKFKLTNQGKQGIAVLKWNTPLEGWFASSFKVTKDDQWVNYTGAMVRRFRPSEQDYVTLLPGKSVEQIANMTEGYDMNTPGHYRVTFNGRLQDVQVIEKDLPLSKQRQLVQINCPMVAVTLQ